MPKKWSWTMSAQVQAVVSCPSYQGDCCLASGQEAPLDIWALTHPHRVKGGVRPRGSSGSPQTFIAFQHLSVGMQRVSFCQSRGRLPGGSASPQHHLVSPGRLSSLCLPVSTLALLTVARDVELPLSPQPRTKSAFR